VSSKQQPHTGSDALSPVCNHIYYNSRLWSVAKQFDEGNSVAITSTKSCKWFLSTITCCNVLEARHFPVLGKKHGMVLPMGAGTRIRFSILFM
jgi:hypothetical protein